MHVNARDLWLGQKCRLTWKNLSLYSGVIDAKASTQNTGGIDVNKSLCISAYDLSQMASIKQIRFSNSRLLYVSPSLI